MGHSQCQGTWLWPGKKSLPCHQWQCSKSVLDLWVQPMVHAWTSGCSCPVTWIDAWLCLQRKYEWTNALWRPFYFQVSCWINILFQNKPPNSISSFCTRSASLPANSPFNTLKQWPSKWYDISNQNRIYIKKECIFYIMLIGVDMNIQLIQILSLCLRLRLVCQKSVFQPNTSE